LIIINQKIKNLDKAVRYKNHAAFLVAFLHGWFFIESEKLKIGRVCINLAEVIKLNKD